MYCYELFKQYVMLPKIENQTEHICKYLRYTFKYMCRIVSYVELFHVLCSWVIIYDINAFAERLPRHSMSGNSPMYSMYQYHAFANLCGLYFSTLRSCE